MNGSNTIILIVSVVFSIGLSIFCFVNVVWHCSRGLNKRMDYWRERCPGHEHKTVSLFVLTIVDLIVRAGFGFVFLGFVVIALSWLGILK
jgi:hypothetical protein